MNDNMCDICGEDDASTIRIPYIKGCGCAYTVGYDNQLCICNECYSTELYNIELSCVCCGKCYHACCFEPLCGKRCIECGVFTCSECDMDMSNCNIGYEADHEEFPIFVYKCCDGIYQHINFTNFNVSIKN